MELGLDLELELGLPDQGCAIGVRVVYIGVWVRLTFRSRLLLKVQGSTIRVKVNFRLGVGVKQLIGI